MSGEAFEDELDAHIAESMKDPEYAAHHHWLLCPVKPRRHWSVAEPSFKAGFREGAIWALKLAAAADPERSNR